VTRAQVAGRLWVDMRGVRIYTIIDLLPRRQITADGCWLWGGAIITATASLAGTGASGDLMITQSLSGL